MMWYKLTGMYIGNQKLRPSDWQPWANTVAYYPLDSANTVNDLSGNWYDLTNSWITFWTYQWVDCADLTTDVFAYSVDAWLPSWSSARTVLFYFYPTTITSDRYFMSYWEQDYYKFFAPRRASINPVIYWFMWYGSDIDTSISWVASARALVTLTYDGTDMNMYVDWVNGYSGSLTLNTTAVWNDWKFVVGCRLQSDKSPWQYITWYMSKLIIEDRAWTQQEVTAYFNLTKWKYWIS